MLIKYSIFLVVIALIFSVNSVLALEDNIENETKNNQIEIKNSVNNLADEIASFLSYKTTGNPNDNLNNQAEPVVVNQVNSEQAGAAGQAQANNLADEIASFLSYKEIDNPNNPLDNQADSATVSQTNSEQASQVQAQNQSGKNENLTGQEQAAMKRQQFAGDRRSEVAAAVQEILNNVESDQMVGGVGEQIREITRNHVRNHENLASHLARIQNQNQFIRFIFGPEPQAVSAARKILQDNKQYLNELETLKSSLESEIDQAVVEQAISQLQAIETEMETIVNSSTKGFSLLGWLINLLSKK